MVKLDDRPVVCILHAKAWSFAVAAGTYGGPSAGIMPMMMPLALQRALATVCEAARLYSPPKAATDAWGI